MTTPNPTGVKTAESIWRRLADAKLAQEPHWSYRPEHKLPTYGQLHPRRQSRAAVRAFLATI